MFFLSLHVCVCVQGCSKTTKAKHSYKCVQTNKFMLITKLLSHSIIFTIILNKLLLLFMKTNRRRRFYEDCEDYGSAMWIQRNRNGGYRG